MKNKEAVYKEVSNIPKGKVSTYKILAEKSGIKNPRVVGLILHRNLNPEKVPCHRVVRSDGTLAEGYAFGGIKKQKEILVKEGIKFNKRNKVDLGIFLAK